jgi:hypothetical protein
MSTLSDQTVTRKASAAAGLRTRRLSLLLLRRQAP